MRPSLAWSWGIVTVLSAAGTASAQGAGASVGAGASTDGATVSGAAEAAPPESAPPEAPAEAGATEAVDPGLDGEPLPEGDAMPADEAGPAPEPRRPDSAMDLRRRQMLRGLSRGGAVGLIRMHEAASTPAGTFAFDLLGSVYSGTGHLCDGAEGGCPSPDGSGTIKDETSQVTARVGISVTPLPFLEAYASFHAAGTSSNITDPGLLQVLGDTDIGLKGFAPRRPDRLWALGGELELWLFNGTGAVGLDGSATSVAMRLLGGMDFTNRSDADRRLPLKLHGMFGYFFDNSGAVVEATEEARGGERITRPERFGLGVNRVDSMQLGLGAEGIFPWVHPFLEWTVDIPVQRQDYVCNTSTLYPGDGCLGTDGGITSAPSRFGIGARIHPPPHGLSATLAFEIGSGAVGNFIEEVAPEAPWRFWFGLGYVVDPIPAPPETIEVEVVREVGTQEVHRYVLGTVRDVKTGEPIPDVIVRYKDQPLTGMVADAQGAFTTTDLAPGEYVLALTAEGYNDGECVVSVPESAEPPPASSELGEPFADGAVEGEAPADAAAPPADPAAPPADPAATEGAPADPAATAAPLADVTEDGDLEVRVDCQLKALPKVGNIVGELVDSSNGAAVGGASVKVTDKLGRSLTLSASAEGAFRFENVPPGTVTISVEAAGYLPSVTELTVESRKDIRATISMNPNPTTASVVIAGDEVKLKKKVHFQHGSAQILPDSLSILQEAAQLLRAHPEIKKMEIQGHTDNTGSPEYNQKLSQARAEAVREQLIALGIEAERLTAVGYGDSKPLVPNVSDENRARNRRVQLIILERQ